MDRSACPTPEDARRPHKRQHIGEAGPAQPQPRVSDASDSTTAVFARQQQPLLQPQRSEQTESVEQSFETNEANTGQRYHRNSRILIEGWLQACRKCSAWTAGTHTADGQTYALCRRCQAQLESSAAKRMGGGGLSLSERQDLCQQALLQAESLRVGAPAAE